ncbi:MAG: diguanylate cyclase [Gemmatimonadota bacterium]
MNLDFDTRPVPPRALALSLGALAVPVASAFWPAARSSESAALLWLLALVPAFLLAYYRGWRGIATALALGMALLALTEVAVILGGRPLPGILPAVVVAYVAIALGVGWMASALHKDRALAADMAFTDILTGLPNRRHCRLFLENEFAAAERGRPLSLILFDLDHFKTFNDRYGHAAGDAALKTFAGILSDFTRRMDLSGRFGGEEFLSVLTASTAEGAVIFADRVRARLEAREIEKDRKITVSAGVATYHPGVRSPDELLAAADQALYEAKRSGRNRVHTFQDPEFPAIAPSRPDPRDLEEKRRGDPQEYPRRGEEMGKGSPPLTLLPHHVTGFGRGRSVLIVEDEDQVRSLLASYLAREGFRVVEAVDVPSALPQLAADFDVLIVDLRLPGASGSELIARARSRWPNVQIVVITGVQDPRMVADSLAAGADAYLFKPFGMPDLQRLIVEALERRDRALGAGASRTPHTEQTRSAILQGVRQLAAALDGHDPYRTGHGVLVGDLAVLIARALDPPVDEAVLEALPLAGELHDLGLLGVDKALLSKPDLLTPEEMETVREHPALGRQIVEGVLPDENILAAILWHHERWDGTGYPDGLAGPAIPLIARVLAVADALDAILRPRPYREARSWDDALRELEEGAGTHFDPDVIAAVVRAAEALRERVQQIPV